MKKMAVAVVEGQRELRFCCGARCIPTDFVAAPRQRVNVGCDYASPLSGTPRLACRALRAPRYETTFSLTLIVLFALNIGCGEEEDKKPADNGPDAVQPEDQGAEAAPDTPAIEKCPDEVDLTTVSLPCDCYGHLATDPENQVPNCKTQVVCCPSIGDLRCEDHEFDIPVEDAVETTEPDTPLPVEPEPEIVQPEPVQDIPQEVAIKKCPFEVDLATVQLPCDCKGTIVDDLKHILPDCTKKIVCCPFKGVICE